MKKNITIIGAGSWGTALALQLASNGHNIKMWSCFDEEINMLKQNRQHVSKLPGVIIPDNVEFTTNINEASKDADVFVMVVPSQTTRENAKLIRKFAENKYIVCCSKGIEDGSLTILSEVVKSEIPSAKIVVLSGPSHAEEVAKNIPTAVVAASKVKEHAEFIQDVFMSQTFRVYTNDDVVGVELGGALKNVIALCAGISDGLGFGDNTKAALMTRGMTEISRLGVAMGANVNTFSGLTGIGDLIVTCTSMHSRNRRAGILIGQGKTLKQALDEVKMVVEGVTTAKAAYKLGKEKGVDMPITNEAYSVLFEGKDPRVGVIDLMTRDKKYEID